MDTINTSEFDEDIALEVEDRQRVRANRQEWLRMTKGQVLLCAFLYFHTVDINAVKALRKNNKAVTPQEIKAAANKALEDRAKSFTPPKSIDQLTLDERLDLSMVQFKSCKAHYQEGVGFALSRMGMDGAESNRVWSKLPPAQQYFSTLLLIYPITADGKHDLEGIKAGKWHLSPWRFGRAMYGQIYDLNDGLRGNNMSLAQQDIRLFCKDATYQKISVSFVGKAAWQQSPGFRKTVLTRAIESYDKLVPFSEVSTHALRQKLGIGGTSLLDVTAGDDFSSLIDQV